MSELDQEPGSSRESEPEPENKGPNLILLYSLLVLALLVAMAFAAFVVWPFYSRR
jgi:hypothetical protein